MKGGKLFNASSLLSLAGNSDLLRLLLYWLSASVVIVWYLQLTVSIDLNVALLWCRQPRYLQVVFIYLFIFYSPQSFPFYSLNYN